MAKKKDVKSILKTQASKEYRQLLQEADKTVTRYSDIVSRAVGKSSDEVAAEIQAIYLDNLRKADDPVALMKENLVNLMLKKQTSDYLKEHMYNKALVEAEESGDEDKIKEIEGDMIDDLLIGEFDLKVHKAIQDSIKAVEKSEPRLFTANSARHDDNIAFEVLPKNE